MKDAAELYLERWQLSEKLILLYRALAERQDQPEVKREWFKQFADELEQRNRCTDSALLSLTLKYIPDESEVAVLFSQSVETDRQLLQSLTELAEA